MPRQNTNALLFPYWPLQQIGQARFMSSRGVHFNIILIGALLCGMLLPTLVQAQPGPPQLPGWTTSASRPNNFKVARSDVAKEGETSVLLELLAARPGGSATLTQSFRVADYAGKRIRMSAFVRTERPEGAAGRGGAQLWMRVDTRSADNRPFDNMTGRPIRGATDWKQHHIVLDVPEDAVGISFGALLLGRGQMWVDDFQFEVVDDSVATTGRNSAQRKPSSAEAIANMERMYKARRTTPRNLGFEQVHRSLGIGVNANSLKVLSVLDGSYASKAGIKEGDLVVSIDEAKVSTRDELVEALNQGEPQKAITVLRGSKRLVFKVDFSDPPAVAKVEKVSEETVAGSGVTIAELNNLQVQNLFLLGKVWGFLKYHHLEVTNGKRQWDADLFRVLPRVLAAGDSSEAQETVLAWIEELGEVNGPTTEVKLPNDLALPPQLDWLSDETFLGKKLSAQLQRIYAARPADGKQFYVRQQPSVGNPIFNEQPHTQVALPDTGYRILTLFRYWNIIEYWFPYRDLIDRDWDDALASYLPAMVAVDDEVDYELTCLKLIVEVGDGHAGLRAISERPPTGNARVPVTIRFLSGRAVVTALSEGHKNGASTGLNLGDVITRIDGQPVEKLVREWKPFYWASNETHRLSTIARNLTRGPAGPCSLEVVRDGAELTIQARRIAELRRRLIPHDLPGETFRMLGDDIAYLKLSTVVASEATSYIRKAAGTKGLIIDIRNYPKEFVVFALGSHLVEKETEFACFTKGDLNNPGAFQWTAPISIKPRRPFYRGKVVLLVDEASASQSEYTAMAFRAAQNSIVIGSTTAGADGNIARIILPGRLATNISGIGVFYPDRKPTQKVGIVPDVEVHPTPEGLREGRDEVLEAAIRQILGEEASDKDIMSRYR